MNPKPTVHVIDNDEAVRDSLRMMLEAEGFPVRAWGSPLTFLTEASLDQACCLLVDVHMPEMNGLALLGRLRDEGKTIPVILMTGLVDRRIQQAAQQAGAPLLKKPFPPGQILKSIENLWPRSTG